MTEKVSKDPRPKRVRIFGKTYTIRYVPETDLPDCLGITYPNRQLILITEGLTPIEEVDTVLHEVMHGIAAQSNLGLDLETEERSVTVLATGLTGVLQDNPKFAHWITEQRSAHEHE